MRAIKSKIKCNCWNCKEKRKTGTSFYPGSIYCKLKKIGEQ